MIPSDKVTDHEIHIHNLKVLRESEIPLNYRYVDKKGRLSNKQESAEYTNNQELIKNATLQLLNHIDKNREMYNIDDKIFKAIIKKKIIDNSSGIFDPFSLFKLRVVQNILNEELYKLRSFKIEKFNEFLLEKGEPPCNYKAFRNQLDELEQDSNSRNLSNEEWMTKARREKIVKEFLLKFNKENENFKLDINIAKSQFMIDIGYQPITNKGATGSKTFRWFMLEHKGLGVFKPIKKPPSMLESFWTLLKNSVQSQETHLSTALEAQPAAEIGTYILTKLLEVDLVCPTKMTTFLEKDKKFQEGSFQLFANGFKEAKSIEKILENCVEIDPNLLLLFQIFTIIDFLSGNMDCHTENWLVLINSNKIIVKIKKIDNANTFPKMYTEMGMISGIINPGVIKQYKWSEINHSHERFCPGAIKLMKKITQQFIDHYIQVMNCEVPDFLTKEMIDLLKERAKVIETLAEEDPNNPIQPLYVNASPYTLSQLKTETQFREFFPMDSDPSAPMRFVNRHCKIKQIHPQAKAEVKKTEAFNSFIFTDDYKEEPKGDPTETSSPASSSKGKEREKEERVPSFYSSSNQTTLPRYSSSSVDISQVDPDAF